MLVQLLTGVEFNSTLGRYVPSGEGLYADLFATEKSGGSPFFRVMRKVGNRITFHSTEGRRKMFWLWQKDCSNPYAVRKDDKGNEIVVPPVLPRPEVVPTKPKRVRVVRSSKAAKAA